jgi:hypothetical protein
VDLRYALAVNICVGRSWERWLGGGGSWGLRRPVTCVPGSDSLGVGLGLTGCLLIYGRPEAGRAGGAAAMGRTSGDALVATRFLPRLRPWRLIHGKERAIKLRRYCAGGTGRYNQNEVRSSDI